MCEFVSRLRLNPQHESLITGASYMAFLAIAAMRSANPEEFVEQPHASVKVRLKRMSEAEATHHAGTSVLHLQAE